MKSSAKLLIISSVLFCLVASEEEQFQTTDDGLIDKDDFQKLRYMTGCGIVKLKSGNYEVLAEEILNFEASYNLTLNKTIFDVSNDSVTICNRPYRPKLIQLTSILFPHVASAFCLLICLLFFSAHKYENLCWTIFAIAFVFYSMNVMCEFIKSYYQQSEYRIPYEIHFIGMQFFFWMSTMACDALMLSPTDDDYQCSRRTSSRSRISAFDLRQVILFCIIRLIFVFAFMALLNVTGVWYSNFRPDDMGNFIKVLIIYVFLNTFNWASLQIFLRMYRSVEIELKPLREVFGTSFMFFYILVFGWFLEYYTAINSLRVSQSFVFHLESWLALFVVFLGVIKFIYVSSCKRNQKFPEPAIVEKIVKKFKISAAPKHERLLEMA